MDWFLYNRDLRHESVNSKFTVFVPNEYTKTKKFGKPK